MMYPQRKIPRAPLLEYNEGEYFVNVCTKSKVHYFGKIRDGRMIYTQLGKMLDEELANVGRHHPHILIPEYVVMPNHFHAIVCVSSTADGARPVPTIDQRLNDKKIPLLSSFVGSVKSAVTRYARMNQMDFGWQPRYHDRMMRNMDEVNRISAYIRANVYRWDSDCFYTK